MDRYSAENEKNRAVVYDAKLYYILISSSSSSFTDESRDNSYEEDEAKASLIGLTYFSSQ